MDQDQTQQMIPPPSASIRSDQTVRQMSAAMAGMLGQAHDLTITLENAELTVPIANEIVATCQRVRKTAKAISDRFVKPFKATIKEIEDAMKADVLSPADEVDTLMRSKLSTYERDRRAYEAKERERLMEESRKRDEDEKVRQAAALEEIAVATGDPHYQRVAEETLDRPTRPTLAGVTVSAKPKPANVSFVADKDVFVDDLMALVRAVAIGAVSLEAVKPDLAWLKREAKQRGEELAVPGVRAVDTIGTRVRS